MANSPEIGLLIGDCWQQIYQLHKSLAELNKTNAQGWAFLRGGCQTPVISGAASSRSIDPDMWRKRAEEARALAEITATAEGKRSLSEIADAYEALASSEVTSK